MVYLLCGVFLLMVLCSSWFIDFVELLLLLCGDCVLVGVYGIFVLDMLVVVD